MNRCYICFLYTEDVKNNDTQGYYHIECREELDKKEILYDKWEL